MIDIKNNDIDRNFDTIELQWGWGYYGDGTIHYNGSESNGDGNSNGFGCGNYWEVEMGLNSGMMYGYRNGNGRSRIK
jgi:hypothetical protein